MSHSLTPLERSPQCRRAVCAAGHARTEHNATRYRCLSPHSYLIVHVCPISITPDYTASRSVQVYFDPAARPPRGCTGKPAPGTNYTHRGHPSPHMPTMATAMLKIKVDGLVQQHASAMRILRYEYGVDIPSTQCVSCYPAGALYMAASRGQVAAGTGSFSPLPMGPLHGACSLGALHIQLSQLSPPTAGLTHRRSPHRPRRRMACSTFSGSSRTAIPKSE